MGLMKINKILKKYTELHKKHLESWNDSIKKIQIASKDMPFLDEQIYKEESYKYQRKGNELFTAMMRELDGKEIFEKKNKNKNEKNICNI